MWTFLFALLGVLLLAGLFYGLMLQRPTPTLTLLIPTVRHTDTGTLYTLTNGDTPVATVSCTFAPMSPGQMGTHVDDPDAPTPVIILTATRTNALWAAALPQGVRLQWAALEPDGTVVLAFSPVLVWINGAERFADLRVALVS
jgi:hypothetical protein